jgi:hypothetical protein
MFWRYLSLSHLQRQERKPAGLWIRIDLMRIRIQHFSSIRIRNFQRQFLSQIFLKSKFESNQIKNTGIIHQNFFQKVVSAILYLFSGKICLTNNLKVHFST